MKPIKTAVLGYGFSAKVFHCPFIEAHEAYELCAIVSRHSKEPLEDYKEVTLIQDYDVLLEDDAIELVVVTTPSHLHFEHAKKALLKGKHVLVEKPYTATYEEALELNRLAKQAGLFIGCYLNRRYDGDFLTIKSLKEAGKLDKMIEVQMTWDRYKKVNSENWKEAGHLGADLVYDLGSHLLDQALTLFGEPISVQSVSKKAREGSKIIDWFQLTMDYGSFTARIKSSLGATYKEPRYRILTEDFGYVFQKMGEQEGQLLSGMKPTDPKYGDSATYKIYDAKGIVDEEQVISGNYLKYYSQMAQAIRGVCEPEVTKEQAALLIKYLEAVGN